MRSRISSPSAALTARWRSRRGSAGTGDSLPFCFASFAALREKNGFTQRRKDAKTRRRVMSRIAVLGWGSLIWDRDGLPVDLPEGHPWHPDGPVLPIEFVRKSSNGRLTLVIWEKGSLVKTRWAPLKVSSLDEAISSLRVREGKIKMEHVGWWSPGGEANAPAAIKQWAEARPLNGVVWTALPSRWKDTDGRDTDGLAPCLEEALTYLRGLTGEQRDRAEKYVRCAPATTDTPFRREFDDKLLWTQWQDCSQSVIPAKARIPLPLLRTKKN